MQYRKTKDGLVVHMINTGGEYQKDAKKYVVNMCSGKKMLHIKNGCRYSKCLYEYISYDMLEEIDNLPIEVSRCELCFPNQNK